MRPQDCNFLRVGLYKYRISFRTTAPQTRDLALLLPP